MEVNWQTLPDSTRENQRLQGGVFITYIELASVSLGDTCMENISWTQASVSGWEFLGGGGGGRFSAPLWQIFFLSAQILALHFSQFVTLASTYLEITVILSSLYLNLHLFQMVEFLPTGKFA